ncbi:EAL domain-containing protein (plasmid) [Vibrio coralliilyticus]|uniref:EAL domain-containing protein n=1 Tax=Vibrio coralliilyticus TaxID=190893 RepID=UPI000A76998E|nr:EAL domain-containing protein [Vibrio coralliilyticus]
MFKKIPVLMVIVAFIWLGTVIMTLVEKINEQSTVITTNWLPSLQLVEQINTLTADLRNVEAMYIITTDAELRREQIQTIERHRQQIEDKLAQYRPLLSSDEERRLYEHFYRNYLNYLSIQQRLLTFSMDHRDDQARAVYLKQSHTLYHRFSDTLMRLSALNKHEAAAASRYGDELLHRVKRTEKGFLLAVTLLLGMMIYVQVRKWWVYRGSTEQRVLRALKNNTFHCVYQPIVDLQTGRIVGVEMLARLTDERGRIPPDAFIPIILDAQKSWAFTRMIIETALGELNTLKSINADFKVGFNLFPSDITSGITQELLDFKGMQAFPGTVAIEIIEAEVLAQKEAQEHIAALKRQGFLIAIDDFGTGYANLNQLEAICGDYLKVDRSFVSDVDTSSIKSSLIPHIVTIANEIGMTVIAEGIETPAQHDALKAMGVQLGQGWFFGKPESLKTLFPTGKREVVDQTY